MSANLPSGSIVTRGKVYAQATGRYLGPISDFEEPVPEPAPAAPSKADLVKEAKALGITGASKLTVAKLKAAIEKAGAEDGEVSTEE